MTQASPEKTVTVVVNAFSTRDGESPTYAEHQLSASSLQRLEELQAMCLRHGLSEVRVHEHPTWGPPGIDSALGLLSCELVVNWRGGVYFSAQGRDECDVQTTDFNVTRLVAFFDEAADGETVMLSSEQAVIEQYADDHGLDEALEPADLAGVTTSPALGMMR